MAKSDATIVDAGGRDLRVSSADRVIFPETERSAAVTKLDIVNYYLSVEDGIMRALNRRPTTLERWPKGVHPGIVLSTREKGGGDAFFQKRVPRGAPDYL
jgi:DNA primase